MEHEDNAQFDNYLQSAQQQQQHNANNNNNNMCAGDSLVEAVVVAPNEFAVGNSAKYEDLDGERIADNDNGEWKYINEVHESEKEQQQQQQGIVENVAASVGNGKQHATNNDYHHHELLNDDEDDDDDDDFEGDGMSSMQYRNNNNNNNHNGNNDLQQQQDEEQHLNGAKDTAATGDDVLQVEMKIEPLQQQILFDEEDPSSNGTSSLSENMQQPMLQQTQHLADNDDEEENELLKEAIKYDSNDDLMADKENAIPTSGSSPHGDAMLRPTELNFDALQPSQLNPDAKEFVPSFSSNATSPTMSENADMAPVMLTLEPVPQQQQQLSAFSRHLLIGGEHDVIIAHSPQKGREIELDSLPPTDYEFEHEAAKRPHSLEFDDDLIGLNENGNANDVQTNLNVHVDVMKQSICATEEKPTFESVENDEAIKDALNKVQPLPTDIESLNSSFMEDENVATPEGVRGLEDLLLDDKEHLSHPPSIEEMQMNLQNSNNKDLLQNAAAATFNLDMNSAAHMQESFYMEHDHDHDQQTHDDVPQMHIDDDAFYAQAPTTVATNINESLLLDETIKYDDNEQQQEQLGEKLQQQELLINTDFTADNKVIHADYDEQLIATNASSPSPHSTVEEKHLVEETKEQLVTKAIDDAQDFVGEIEKKMKNLLSTSTGTDGDLKQYNSPFIIKDEDVNFQNDAPPFEAHEEQFEEIKHEQVEQIANELETEVSKNEIAQQNDVATSAPIEIEQKSDETHKENDALVTNAAEIAAAAAVVATTAVAAAAVTAAKVKKAETKKSTTSVAATTKIAAKPNTAPTAAKKATTTTSATNDAKKLTAKTSSTSTASAAARPRTAPAKTTGTVPKTTVGTVLKKTTAPTTTTTVAAKPLASSKSVATKSLASSGGVTSRAGVTTKTTSTATTAARKSAHVTATAATATSKPRPASAQPTKPTSLTLTKPKISPRATLTSQLRNKVGTTSHSNGGTNSTAAITTTAGTATTVKSPTKTATHLTNGVATTRTSSGARTKSAASAISATGTVTTTTTSTTKTFTARPAPRTASTTARRSLATSQTAATKGSPIKATTSSTSKVASPRAAATRPNTKDVHSAVKSPTKVLAKTPIKTSVATKTKIDDEKAKIEDGKLQQQEIILKNGDLHEATEQAEEAYNQQNGESVDTNPLIIDA